MRIETADRLVKGVVSVWYLRCLNLLTQFPSLTYITTLSVLKARELAASLRFEEIRFKLSTNRIFEKCLLETFNFQWPTSKSC